MSTDGGTTYSMLNDGIFDMYNGSYDWAVTDNIGTNNLIQIANTSLGIAAESVGTFTIISSATPTLSISSPNGGEQVQQNGTVPVNWTTDNFVGNENLVVEYSTDGASWLPIASGIVDNLSGEYLWYVDAAKYDIGSNYKLRIRNSDNSVNDESDNAFGIITPGIPSVTLISPNGGESFVQNDVVTIVFSVNGLSGDEILDFDFSTDNGSNWINIGSGSVSALNSEFNFIADENTFTIDTNYLLRVANSDESLVDQSAAAFSVEAPAPLLSVISPNGQEQIEQNTTHFISWDLENIAGVEQLVIEYSVDAPHEVWNEVITSTVSAFNGSYTWFIDKNKALV